MGSALASTLLDAKYDVSVWNRSRHKAEPFTAAGAHVKEGVGDAIRSSDVIVVCFLNYAHAEEAFADSTDLSGKTIIQLSTGVLQAAEQLKERVTGQGAKYLDGAILGGPTDVGTKELTIAIAGDDDGWHDSREIIIALGGSSVFLGANLEAPLAFEAATSGVILIATLGAINGAHLLEKTGVSLDLYAERLPDLASHIGYYMQAQIDAIANNKFDSPQAALETWAAGLRSHIHEPDLQAPFRLLMDQAVEAGYGGEEVGAVIKVLRNTLG